MVTGEPTAIRENGASSGAGVLATYAYDDLGRRSSLTRGDGSVLSYSYDAVSRLTQLADNLAGTAYDQTLGFGYTPASQIASTTRSNDSDAWTGHYNLNRGYTANGRNQYTAVASITPSYDAKGNLTSAGATAYGYTSENLLTSASGGIALSYDPAMRLYQTSGGTAGTTRFAYDGTALIAEYNGSNTLLRRYVHGPGTDEPIAWYEGSGTSDRRFLHADERGSVVVVTNSSGTTLNVNGYDEYGIPSSGNVGRFQYTGQTWLPELGMYYYKARIYSPTLGRFLQPDPIGYGDGMNMYAYVGGDPVNFTDPTGLEEEPAPEEETIYVDGHIDRRPALSGTAALMGAGRSRGQPAPNVDVDGDGAPDPDIVVTGQKPPPPPLPPLPQIVAFASPPTRAPCFSLAQRREHHDRWVAREAARLRAEGYQVATEVSMRVWTPKGSVMARADIVARLPSSRYYLINEIKTGDARFSRNQNIVYNANVAVIAGTNGIAIGLPPGSHLPLSNFASTRCGGLG